MADNIIRILSCLKGEGGAFTQKGREEKTPKAQNQHMKSGL